MNYAAIRNCDIANGDGVRVSLFVSGCTHHCKGCFNPDQWSFDSGEQFTLQTENRLLSLLEPSHVAGISLLGGEPMEPENQRCLVPFLRRFREKFDGEKTVWVYTGCIYENLLGKRGEYHWRTDLTDEFLSLVDVLVDGPFVEELKDISLKFRGSSNQRIIKLKGEQ